MRTIPKAQAVYGDRMTLKPMMTTRDVADYFGITLDAVQKWRYRKMGPKFTRIAWNCVLYKRKDVLRWEKTRAVNSGGRPKKNAK